MRGSKKTMPAPAAAVEAPDSDQNGDAVLAAPPEATKTKRTKSQGNKSQASATRPAVNLISDWARADLAVVTLRRRMGIAAVAIIVLTAAVVSMQQFRAASLDRELESVSESLVQLRSQAKELEPVAEYVGAVEQRSELVSRSMYTAIDYTSVYKAFAARVPAGVVLSDMSFSVPSPTVESESDSDGPDRGVYAQCSVADPFQAQVIVACISFSGTASSRAALSSMVQALNNDPMFSVPYIANSDISGEGEVTFAGNVGVSPRAFSREYDALPFEVKGEEFEPEPLYGDPVDEEASAETSAEDADGDQ